MVYSSLLPRTLRDWNLLVGIVAEREWNAISIWEEVACGKLEDGEKHWALTHTSLLHTVINKFFLPVRDCTWSCWGILALWCIALVTTATQQTLPTEPWHDSNFWQSTYTYCLIYSLTHSWSWALLEKLSIVQLLKSFPSFYGTRRFITLLTRALHWSLSWARSIQSIPSCLSKIHFNIVHPPTSWSSQWFISFWLSHQYPIRIF
jgi:hypothetical protein